MIRIEHTQTYGWEAAVRGMRNPMNSWSKSDSYWGLKEDEAEINPNDEPFFFVGENDLSLMRKLVTAGSDHRKFMRMIVVSADITAPLYWWKEYDTYKVGTVANSCSTMHKIHSKEFTLSDFSTEHLLEASMNAMQFTIDTLNCYREMYLTLGRMKELWWQMIQLLPSSYNQRRTVMLNYEVLRNIYHARNTHKLDEWRDLCKWIETLPYQELITCP